MTFFPCRSGKASSATRLDALVSTFRKTVQNPEWQNAIPLFANAGKRSLTEAISINCAEILGSFSFGRQSALLTCVVSRRNYGDHRVRTVL